MLSARGGRLWWVATHEVGPGVEEKLQDDDTSRGECLVKWTSYTSGVMQA